MPRNKRKTNNVQLTSNQANQLINLLNNMKIVSPPKRKNKRRKKRSINNQINDGRITISRTDLLATISIPASSNKNTSHTDFVIDNFSYLKSLGAHFERVKWLSIDIFYKPAVGTTYGGLITMGFDWDNTAEPTDRPGVSALTPSTTTALWNEASMSLPSNQLMSRNWYLPTSTDYNDKGPGRLWYSCIGSQSTSAQTVGELWVKYRIVMDGTK